MQTHVNLLDVYLTSLERNTYSIYSVQPIFKMRVSILAYARMHETQCTMLFTKIDKFYRIFIQRVRKFLWQD